MNAKKFVDWAISSEASEKEERSTTKVTFTPLQLPVNVIIC